MQQLHTIELTKQECLDAGVYGVKRRLTNLFKEVGNWHSGMAKNGDWWGNDIEASGAEAAFAKFIGEKWVGSVNTFDKPDVGDEWQVRYTSYDNGCLIIRERDKSKQNDKFVLVTGAMPTYRICGYMTCSEACVDKFLRNPNNMKKAWFVPQHELNLF